MPDAESGPFLSVGTIRKPHGVRGELVVALETDRPDEVFRPGRVLEIGDAFGVPLGGRLTVERVRPFKDAVLLRAMGLDQLTPEVEALRGRTLLIPVAEAAPVAEGEFHYRDLVGLTVVDYGKPVGVVRAVVESAGGELLAVNRPDKGELLMPFVAEWVKGVDAERRELRVELPAGLLEL